QGGTRLFGLPGALQAARILALQLRLRIVTLPGRIRGGLLALLYVVFCLCQAVGVLVGGITLQGFQPFSGSGLRQAAAFVRLKCQVFLCPCLLQRFQGAVACLAGVVEAGLCLAQLARLAPRQHAGIAAIAMFELCHRVFQSAGFVELVAILFQLIERLGHVTEQFSRQRRKRLAQSVGQAGVVVFLRQLWLAPLDQGVYQRIVAALAQVKQPLVHCAAVALAALEQLAPPFDRLTQALAGQDNALPTGQPQILSQTRGGRRRVAFQQEKPTVYLGAAG